MTTRPRISPQVPQSCTGRPSVSLSAYRELVKEFQATQSRVTSLEAQNQQLVKSNWQLRQEIETVVAQGRRLEKVVESFERNPVEEPSSLILGLIHSPNLILFFATFNRLGTCPLIMYLLGERSSPLHCGQNPLLSGRKACALRSLRFADHPK